MITQQANYQNFKSRLKVNFLTLAMVFMTTFSTFAGHGPESEGEKEAFNAGEVIMHHVMDNHEIHIGPLHIPLPIILYSKEKGLDMFSSSHLSHGDPYNGYIMEHEKIYFAGKNGEVERDAEGHIHAEKPLDLSITKTVFGLFLTIGLMLFLFIKTANGYKAREGQSPKGVQSVM